MLTLKISAFPRFSFSKTSRVLTNLCSRKLSEFGVYADPS